MVVKEVIRGFVSKKNVYLVDSWETAISSALDRCYEAGSEGFSFPSTLLIPDQGGRGIFLAQKDNFNVVKVKTHLGALLLTHLRTIANEKSMLLMSSLGGFFVKQSMREIDEICKIKNTLLINDVSGSIFSYDAGYGDVVIGSFKPSGFNYGGFIACDEKLNINENFDMAKIPDLIDWIEDLNARLVKVKDKCRKVKEDLKDFEVVHRESDSLVVVVRYRSDEEKSNILKYCEDNKFEYLECPRYSRVKEKAISIEVKNELKRA